MKATLALLSLVTFVQGTALAAPTVSNVRAAQRPGTQLVDIYYDLADATNSTVTVGLAVSTNSGSSYFRWPYWPWYAGGDVGSGVTPGMNKKITWNAGADWPGQYSTKVRFRVVADDQPQTNSLSLFIGSDVANTTNGQHTDYMINAGDSFCLAWVNNLNPTQYPNCSTHVPSAFNGVWPTWVSAVETNRNSGYVILTSPTNLEVATYVLMMQCTADPTNSNPQLPKECFVYLQVFSSTLGEK